jgi:hypothetical protein
VTSTPGDPWLDAAVDVGFDDGADRGGHVAPLHGLTTASRRLAAVPVKRSETLAVPAEFGS